MEAAIGATEMIVGFPKACLFGEPFVFGALGYEVIDLHDPNGQPFVGQFE